MPSKTPEELTAIRKRLQDANAETEKLLTQLSTLDTRILNLNRSISEGEQQAAELQQKVQSSGDGITWMQTRRADLRVLWSQRARQFYKYAPATAWAPLLSLKTWSDFGRFKKILKGLAESQVRLANESGRLKEQLLREKTELAAASEALEKHQSQMSSERERLRRSREEKTASLGHLRFAVGQAMQAQQAALVADAVGVPVLHPCSFGAPEEDRKLDDLLEWYAPASGLEPFVPPRLTPTGVSLPAQASWYGPGFEGCRASSGSTFRSNQMTAASLTLPFGTLLKVTNEGKAAVVVITDRGPYVPGRDLDLSRAAAEAIGLQGVGPVTMEILLPSLPAPPYP